MKTVPLPLVLSLAGMSWVEGMAARLLTILYPIIAIGLQHLISSVSHSKVFSVSVTGAFWTFFSETWCSLNRIVTV